MPHIKLNEKLPGLLSLFDLRPDIERPMRELVEIALRKSSLGQFASEMIAVRVSFGNGCEFCYKSHMAAQGCCAHMAVLPDDTKREWLKSLLLLSDDVRNNIRPSRVSVDYCKFNNATDGHIHDTVFITSVFSMLNRYVDGLNTPLARDYYEMGKKMAEIGYLNEEKVNN